MKKQKIKRTRFVELIALALALCFSPCVAWGTNTVGKAVDKGDVKEAEFRKGELLVKFRQGVGLGRIRRIQSRAGVEILRRFPRLGVQHLKITSAGLSVKEAAKLLNKLPEVLYAEPNYKLSIATTPNDLRFSELWGLHNTGQTSGTGDADIDAPEAWDITTGSSDIVAGVIDTGVDYTHEDLTANMWTNPGETPGNGIDDDGNGYVDDIYGIDAINNDSDPYDDNGHGTHCSGTIGAAGNNGIGVAGINWNIKIMALKFLDESGSGWTSDAVECLDYAVMMKTTYGVNLKLTSNSWGGGGFSQAMKDAIEASGAAGMLFMAAAGNSGTNNDLSPHYPSSYEVANVLSVAATDHNDGLAGLSCYGAVSVDLGAPGVSILSTTPGNTYSLYSGTSMATPHVSGAAALVWAYDPTLSHLDVKEMLMGTVDPLPSLDGKVLTGGRLNVFNAITCDPSIVNFAASLKDGFTAELGASMALSARLTACAPLTGAAVSAAFSNGDPTIALADNGVSPDAAAGDGVYTGLWTPDALGAVTVTFAAVHDGNTYTAAAASEVVEFMGYYYDDTAPFDWIDISATGTPLDLWDDGNAYFGSPFPVNFYDVEYNQISVGSNGHIYFEDNFSDYINDCIPADTGSVNTYIAGLWDDLNPEAGGQIYWEVRGTAPNRMLIVQFEKVPQFDAVGTVSFEIILHEDSDDILMQYLDVDFGVPAYDFGASATVGLQRDAAYGQQYSCSEPAIADQMAILWYRTPGEEVPTPIISLSKTSISHSCEQGIDASARGVRVWNSGEGTLCYAVNDDALWFRCWPDMGDSTGEEDTLTVIFDTSSLNVGSYSATITITDPSATNSPQYVYVDLTVTPVTYTLTTTASPTEGGTITGSGTYNDGEVAKLRANPNSGWMFDHWEGDGVAGSTANPKQITMNRHKSVTAVFTPSELTRINLVSPSDQSAFSSPPTFTWRSEGGSTVMFAVDASLSPTFATRWSTWENLRLEIYQTRWTMPQWIWNKIPSGRQVYWRVRGVDWGHEPRTVITSDEVWEFYKK